jgi:hypothetical protein
MHAEKVKIIEQYSGHEYYAQARIVVECARFRDLSIARKKESLRVFFSIARTPQVYKELRFYQGLCYLFFRW